MNKISLRTHVMRMSVLSGSLLLALGLTIWVVHPLTAWLIPQTEVGAILVYLPHGVRVLAAWLFGWASVIYTLPANVIHIAANGGTQLGGAALAAMLVVVTLSPPLAFRILAFFGFDLHGNAGLRFNWRSVVFAGGLASLINALALHAIGFDAIPAEEHLVGIAYWVIGDMVGVVVVLGGMLALDRWMRGQG